MDNEKILNQFFNSKASLLRIKANSSFAKTLKKVFKSKKADFVWVEKPKPLQMSAVLLNKIIGKKIFWIQSFSNPPVPNFFARLLLNQADEILVESRRIAAKLKSLGVEKPKIKLIR